MKNFYKTNHKHVTRQLIVNNTSKAIQLRIALKKFFILSNNREIFEYDNLQEDERIKENFKTLFMINN